MGLLPQDGSKKFPFYFRGKEDVQLQKLRARFATVGGPPNSPAAKVSAICIALARCAGQHLSLCCEANTQYQYCSSALLCSPCILPQ